MVILLLAAPPQVVEDFRPNTVVAEGQNMTFKCIAQGYPAPTISWQHAGRAIVNGDSPYFTVNSTEMKDGFIATVTGYLNLSSADDSVNGEVRCIASPPAPDVVGGMVLDSDYTSTQLNVLGKYISLNPAARGSNQTFMAVHTPTSPQPTHRSILSVCKHA